MSENDADVQDDMPDDGLKEEGSPVVAADWIDWPLRDGGWRSIILTLGLVAFCAFVGKRADSVLAAAVVFAVVAASLESYWLPSHFKLDAHGVSVTRLGSRLWLPWRQVRVVLERPSGAMLFQTESTRWIDAIDAMFLPWSSDPEAVRQLLAQNCRHARRIAA